MANMIDYINWRGDITFKERPFNDVDNILLSELAYVELSECIDFDEKLTMKEVSERYFGYMKLRNRTNQVESVVLKAMAESERFKDSIVYNVILKRDNDTQFAAICVALPDKSIYIAFRGTDDAIAGWKEDFALSFKETNAQAYAVSYLSKSIRRKRTVYRVGGHSKGGNLALYATLKLPEEKQNVIRNIYVNDSPGICPEMLDLEKYNNIKNKIIKIVPEFCIVGRMFEIDAKEKVVISDANGLFQHNPFGWQVMGDSFVETDKVSDDCKIYNDIFDKWIESATMEERESFTNSFFAALEATGAKNISQIGENGIKGFVAMISSMTNIDEYSKSVFIKLISTATNQFREIDVENIKAITIPAKGKKLSHGKRKRVIKNIKRKQVEK